MIFSFSKIDAHGKIVSIWSPEISGDYEKDTQKGREYATEVVAEMRRGDNPAILGWIVRYFGQDETRRGVEIGFCQQIAEHVLS